MGAVLGRVADVANAFRKKTVTTIEKVPGGKKLIAAAARTHHYCCWEPNPLLQMVYGGLVLGGYGVMIWKGYPHIPNLFMSAYHKFVGILMLTMTMWSWYLVCSTDPGTITQHNWKRYFNYKYDGVLYPEFDEDGNRIEFEVPALVPAARRSC